MVVADLDGVLHGLGARVGKKGGAETELRGDLHELVVKMGGWGSPIFPDPE